MSAVDVANINTKPYATVEKRYNAMTGASISNGVSCALREFVPWERGLSHLQNQRVHSRRQRWNLFSNIVTETRTIIHYAEGIQIMYGRGNSYYIVSRAYRPQARC